MINNKLHYIGPYAKDDDERNLLTFPSALTKMNYVLSVLKRINFNITIFSPTVTKNNSFIYFPWSSIKMDDTETLIRISTFGTPNLILKFLSRIWMLVQLLFYLFIKVKKYDIVVVYHVLLYKYPIKLAKFFRDLNIYYEVEEIFNAAWMRSELEIANEIKYLSKAKGYILVNDIIGAKCGFRKQRHAVCYGNYSYRAQPQSIKNEEKINLVYAGAIAERGTDVYLAIETIRYLPEKYRLHILGYGPEKYLEEMKNQFKDVNIFLGYEAIVYSGCLSGEEYFQYLADCQIGLCTRVLEDNLSDYTFPSKVLVYLSNGLIPVCSPIKCVSKSKVADCIAFTKDTSPKSVADAILTINFDKAKNNEALLRGLDRQFENDLKMLFS